MHPMVATHTMEATPSVVASLYPGSYGSGSPRCIRPATLEPYLVQVGQGATTIGVAFRRYDQGEQMYEHEFLKLTVTDARELVTALQYVNEAAERG